MPLRCLIADDEPLAHNLLENYIARLKTLSVVGHAYNAFEVLDFLGENHVDILFLDINMPDLSGLEMLKTLNHAQKLLFDEPGKKIEAATATAAKDDEEPKEPVGKQDA